MPRRDAETIRDLVAMLREDREKAETAEMLRNDARYYAARAAKADALRAGLEAAEARIADLEARPAAPSVEQVADALADYLCGPLNMPGAIAKICGVDWDCAQAALDKAMVLRREEKGDAS